MTPGHLGLGLILMLIWGSNFVVIKLGWAICRL